MLLGSQGGSSLKHIWINDNEKFSFSLNPPVLNERVLILLVELLSVSISNSKKMLCKLIFKSNIISQNYFIWDVLSVMPSLYIVTNFNIPKS